MRLQNMPAALLKAGERNRKLKPLNRLWVQKKALLRGGDKASDVPKPPGLKTSRETLTDSVREAGRLLHQQVKEWRTLGARPRHQATGSTNTKGW